MDFPIRALEIHDASQMWNRQRLIRTLTFMEKQAMNVLVLHQVDIVDEVMFPGKIFDPALDFQTIQEAYQKVFRQLYGYAPRRRSAPNHRLEFLRLVIREASQAGIAVYLENKEIWFPEIVLELHPYLFKDGNVCPSEPFWWEEFLPAKYQELFTIVPELSGIITSTATGESKISITRSRCRCSQCQAISSEMWHKHVIQGIYRPLKEAGKTLVIRDFVFDRASQQGFAEAAQDLPSDIIISIKNTPHDFYPTFPNNPLIGRVGDHAQWIEFDAMAQYFGWGIAPSIMIDDMRKRMTYALEKKATGIIIRTDWESLRDHTCFDTPNILNLYGAACLSKQIHTQTTEIYAIWLREEKMLNDSSALHRCIDTLNDIFENTWPIVQKALYMNGCVFNDCSTMPVSLEHASWLAEEKNSLKDWDPDKHDALVMTTENVLKVFDEKDAALQEYTSIYEQLRRANPGLRPHVYEDLLSHFYVFGTYLKGFVMIGKAFALTGWLLREGERADFSDKGPALPILSAFLRELETYERSLREAAPGLDAYPARLLLNPDRVACFRTSIIETIKQIQEN